jgi:pSer/pThr/pTyr-binding forkhead associated (FHA) protein
MAISTVIEKLGRAIFEAPFGGGQISKDAPELAEIRLAVLDAVKSRSHRSSGKSVFPHNLVRIELLGVPEDQAPIFQSDFLGDYLAGELRTSLKRSGYRFPNDLQVEIVTTPRLPGEKENWLSVETAFEERKPERPAAHLQPAKLFVLAGTANQSELEVSKARTNIGRTEEVFRQEGPSRRNDLAFTEENEINRTVSREHAHILYSQKSGEYRIFNDRWYKGQSNCALWIVRDGLSQPVHRSVRGTMLQAGDEIHLGNAVLRFERD